MKAASILVLALSCLVLAPPLFAEKSLSANDLQPAVLVAPTGFGDFTLLATADKGVTIEAVSEARSAADGEVFNLRIKLNGGGSATFRALKFTIAGPATLTIYLNSSSKTDARVLKVTDASGTTVAELAAPIDDGRVAGMVTLKLEKPGDYLVFSASGGINLYAVVLK